MLSRNFFFLEESDFFSLKHFSAMFRRTVLFLLTVVGDDYAVSNVEHCPSAFTIQKHLYEKREFYKTVYNEKCWRLVVIGLILQASIICLKSFIEQWLILSVFSKCHGEAHAFLRTE